MANNFEGGPHREQQYDAYTDLALSVLVDEVAQNHDAEQAAFERATKSGMSEADALGAIMLEQSAIALGDLERAAVQAL